MRAEQIVIGTIPAGRTRSWAASRGSDGSRPPHGRQGYRVWQPSSVCTSCTRHRHVPTRGMGAPDAAKDSGAGTATRGEGETSGKAGQCHVADMLGYLAGAGGGATARRGVFGPAASASLCSSTLSLIPFEIAGDRRPASPGTSSPPLPAVDVADAADAAPPQPA